MYTRTCILYAVGCSVIAYDSFCKQNFALQRPRPNAAPTFPPTAFAIKQKPLEIEFVRKVKRSDRLLAPLVPAFPYSSFVYRHRSSHHRVLPPSASYPPPGFSVNEGRDAHSRTNLLSNRNAREVRKKIEMRVQIWARERDLLGSRRKMWYQTRGKRSRKHSS